MTESLNCLRKWSWEIDSPQDDSEENPSSGWIYVSGKKLRNHLLFSDA